MPCMHALDVLRVLQVYGYPTTLAPRRGKADESRERSERPLEQQQQLDLPFSSSLNPSCRIDPPSVKSIEP